MFRLSNTVIGILNLVTLLLSVPILLAGIWLSRQASTDCEKFLQTPIIVIGIFLMVVSVAGLIGACCRVSILFWLYLLAMFLLIFLLFCITIFVFLVTYRGAGDEIPGKGYKEYRLGNYSHWLQERFNDTNNWSKIKSCLQDANVCQSLIDQDGWNITVKQFYLHNLSSVQSGCCKPSNDCNFVYVSPTNWTAGASPSFKNSDCSLWNSSSTVLCLNCTSCKAGLLDNIKHTWKKVALFNIIFLVNLVIVYSIGCYAFRNNMEDNYLWKRKLEGQTGQS